MSIGERPDRSAAAAKAARNAPVIVMTYAGSGADRLRSVLSAFPELACTQWTGMVPLIHLAVTTWQEVDGGAEGAFSPLAAASVRALGTGLVTAILAREGGERWCEFSSAPPVAAQTLARLYPHTRFLTVHRRADTMMRAVLGSSPWGLEGPEFAPFVAAYPANPVAALASYWAAHTAGQLEFEDTCPETCRRVRVEDLTANPAQSLQHITDFLDLDRADASARLIRDDSQGWQAAAPAGDLPLDRIPASLLEQMNELHHTLGYPPMAAAGAQRSDWLRKSRT